MGDKEESTTALVSPKSYRKKTWSGAQYAYAWWLAMPKSHRQPRNKGLLAEQLHLNIHTLATWDKLPGFADLIREQAMKMVGAAWPQVLHAMIREAQLGNVEAAKFVGRILGPYSERKEISGDPNRPFIFRIVPGQQQSGDVEVVEGEVVGSPSGA